MNKAIDNIVKHVESLETELDKLKNDLVSVSAEIKINEISNETKLLVGLKYDKFEFFNLESWKKLSDLNEDLLLMWYRYLAVNADLPYINPNDTFSESSYKKLRSFSYDIIRLIHNFIFEKKVSPYYTASSVYSKYCSLTSDTRSLANGWLEKLNEIIMIYENKELT